MEDTIVAAVVTAIVCLPGGFALGVLFHRQIISEADTLKDHVTNEIANLRADFKALTEKIAARL